MTLRTLTLLVLLAGCSGDPQPPTQPVRQGPLDIRSLSFPAHWLVQRVGGEHVQLRPILPVGEDAPHWQPEAELIAGLAEADLIVANGAGFEAWVATATLPADKLVLTATSVDTINLASATHSHGTAGEHSHGEIDPHTWSSPADYAEQARTLATALGQADPEHAPAYAEAADALAGELQQISEAYAEAFSRAGDSVFAANHPAYNYLARELEVDIHSFDYDPGQVPSDEQLAAFTAWAAEAEAPILLWEAVPSSEVKAAFPSGVRHVWLDPLEQPVRGGDYDYLAQVRTNIAAVGDLFPLTAVEDQQAAKPLPAPPTVGAPVTKKPRVGKGGKGVKAGR